MTYSAQTFTALNVLTATQMNQVETNIRDHKHGQSTLSINLDKAFKLISMLHAHTQTTRRDLCRIGFRPAMFNQQWGGGIMPFENLVDGATGTAYKFDSATCYIVNNGSSAVADAAARTYISMGFKAGQAITVAGIWIKALKVGNPTGNLSLKIVSDSAGVPSGTTAITNGTATAISGKLFSSKAEGEWVRFSFSTPPTLVAGTQYHILLNSSAAVDASNYWKVLNYDAKTYPFGNYTAGDATPTFTATTTLALDFIVEPSATYQYLQSSGIFSDGKIVCSEGSPLNQSQGFTRSINDIRGFDITEGSVIIRGTAFTKDKTIWEMQYGMNHDRIVLRANVTTGYAQVDLYESDGTKATVTATSVDLSSGSHDIMVAWRAKNDGSDYLKLYVNGASNGSQLSGASYDFDKNFQVLGTEWLGGGFMVAPTMTGTAAMSVLPSADSPAWTWTGTATEANAMSVSGGKLYQNYGGYTSTQNGYYAKATAGFNNANGGSAIAKVRNSRSTNTVSEVSCHLKLLDGTKSYFARIQEHYIQCAGASFFMYDQADYKTVENVLHIILKGSDAFVFRNGKLVADATGDASSSATNEVQFGDNTTTAGENADAVWDYVSYYNTAWIAPQFTGGSISEYALWTGDQTSLASPLYNSGTRVSVKEYIGANKNWVAEQEVIQQELRQGITNTVASTTTTFPPTTIVTDLEAFVIGSYVEIKPGTAQCYNSTDASSVYASGFVDGGHGDTNLQGAVVVAASGASGGHAPAIGRVVPNTYFGPHKLDIRFNASANTATFQRRSATFEARA